MWRTAVLYTILAAVAFQAAYLLVNMPGKLTDIVGALAAVAGFVCLYVAAGNVALRLFGAQSQRPK